MFEFDVDGQVRQFLLRLVNGFYDVERRGCSGHGNGDRVRKRTFLCEGEPALVVVKNYSRIVVKTGTQISQLYAAAASFDDRIAELGFDALYRLGNGRLRAKQSFGSPGHGLVVCNGAEVFQMLELHKHHPISVYKHQPRAGTKEAYAS